MYDNFNNEYKTKENKNWTKDEIELQHMQHVYILLTAEAVFAVFQCDQNNRMESPFIFLCSHFQTHVCIVYVQWYADVW